MLSLVLEVLSFIYNKYKYTQNILTNTTDFVFKYVHIRAVVGNLFWEHYIWSATGLIDCQESCVTFNEKRMLEKN